MNKQESTGWKHFNGFKTFIDYSSNIGDIYRNIEKYNLHKRMLGINYLL